MYFKSLPLKTCALILLTPFLGLFLMICAYLLPTERMKGHIAQSDDVFNYEGIYPQVMNGIKSSQLDNYTDGLMYATAIHPGSGHVLQDALLNAHFEYEENNMVQSLNDYANDVSVKEPFRYEMTYPRYWHGYLILLKPLLLFLNVGEIRLLNMLIQTSLLFLLLYLIQKRIGSLYTIPVLLTVLALNPVVLPLSLQFSWVYILSLFGSIVLLLITRAGCARRDVCLLLFLELGMLTSFLDLLTYPLITLGLPLVLYLLIYGEDRGFRSALETLMLSLVWGIGYAVMWAGKWIFASLFCGINIRENVMGKILERTSMTGEFEENLTLSMAVRRPLSVLLEIPYCAIFFLFFIICILLMIKRKKMILKGSFSWILPFCIVAVEPFILFCVLSNHTWVHYWYVYRNLGISILAVSTILIKIISIKDANV